MSMDGGQGGGLRAISMDGGLLGPGLLSISDLGWLRAASNLLAHLFIFWGNWKRRPVLSVRLSS